MREHIATTLRTRLSLRHVPVEVIEAPAILHTINRNRLEVSIKKLVDGPTTPRGGEHQPDDCDALLWFERFTASRMTNSPH